MTEGADAFASYELMGPEKHAILDGDMEWIEWHVGPVTPTQARWLEQRPYAEVW